MPADQAIAEEEEDFARALACADVAGDVAVGVANEAGAARSLGEAQAEIKHASDVAQDALDCSLMFHRGPLHEPPNIADDKRQDQDTCALGSVDF